MAGSIVPLSQRLYDESHSLLLKIPDHLEHYCEALAEAHAVLKTGQEASGIQSIQDFFQPMHQLGNAAKVNKLFKKLDEIEAAYQKSSLSALNGNIAGLNGDLHLTMIRVLSLAEMYGHTWNTIKHNFLPLWNYYRAVAALYVFSVFQTEYRAVLIFLNRPFAIGSVPEYLLDFAKTVGMELTSRVVPLTAMLDALLDLSATRLERDMKKIRQTDVSARILLMKDHLFIVSNHIMTADSMLSFTLSFLQESEMLFGPQVEEILKQISNAGPGYAG